MGWWMWNLPFRSHSHLGFSAGAKTEPAGGFSFFPKGLAILLLICLFISDSVQYTQSAVNTGKNIMRSGYMLSSMVTVWSDCCIETDVKCWISTYSGKNQDCCIAHIAGCTKEVNELSWGIISWRNVRVHSTAGSRVCSAMLWKSYLNVCESPQYLESLWHAFRSQAAAVNKDDRCWLD